MVEKNSKPIDLKNIEVEIEEPSSIEAEGPSSIEAEEASSIETEEPSSILDDIYDVAYDIFPRPRKAFRRK